MIKQLQISNFQSHENTKLEFHPGVNIIIGTSDEGKSVVLRVLEWIIDNRPLGLSFVSHWNIDEKDNIFESVLGKVIIDENEIIRKKTNKFNGYIINGKELEAIGTEVPKEVKNIFNFSEVNIQKQFDAPFLLSKGSGEVARFFNGVIKIDDIDKMLALVESKKRKTRSDLNYIEEDLKEVEKSLRKLDWLDEANILLRKIERINNNIEKNELLQSALKELLNRKIKIEESIDKIDIQNIKIILDKIKEIGDLLQRQEEGCIELKKLFDSKIIINEKIIEYKKISNISNYFEEIRIIQEKIDKQKEQKNLFLAIRNNYKDLKQRINNNKEERKILKKQLPDKCPVCGQILKEEEIL